jgi:hypothetical protein
MRLTISEAMLEEAELWVPVDDVVVPDRRLLSRELVRELVTLLTADMVSSSSLQILSETGRNNLSRTTYFFGLFFRTEYRIPQELTALALALHCRIANPETPFEIGFMGPLWYKSAEYGRNRMAFPTYFLTCVTRKLLGQFVDRIAIVTPEGGYDGFSHGLGATWNLSAAARQQDTDSH